MCEEVVFKHKMLCYYTVDVERFTVLNIHGFNCIEVFAEIRLYCLSQKCLLFNVIKERCLYSWKNLHSTLKNYENRESST